MLNLSRLCWDAILTLAGLCVAQGGIGVLKRPFFVVQSIMVSASLVITSFVAGVVTLCFLFTQRPRSTRRCPVKR